MKILASGDHHFEEDGRFEETVRIHDWMVEEARRQGVGLFLSAGDVRREFEPYRAAFEKRAANADAARQSAATPKNRSPQMKPVVAPPKPPEVEVIRKRRP